MHPISVFFNTNPEKGDFTASNTVFLPRLSMMISNLGISAP
jgi:hypothetical protein